MAEQDVNASEQTNPLSNNYLSEIIKSVMASHPPTDESAGIQTNGIAHKAESANNSSSDLLSSLLSNPELIAKLPSLISTIKPIMEMMSRRSDSSSIQAGSLLDADKKEASDPLPLQSDKKDQHISDQRSALLCAMKPYLSHDRQNAIDYIIKLSRLGDMLKNL